MRFRRGSATKPGARLLLAPNDLSDAVRREIMSSLRMANGVFRYTYAHRLDDLNDRVGLHLSTARPLQLIDVGVVRSQHVRMVAIACR